MLKYVKTILGINKFKVNFPNTSIIHQYYINTTSLKFYVPDYNDIKKSESIHS